MKYETPTTLLYKKFMIILLKFQYARVAQW